MKANDLNKMHLDYCWVDFAQNGPKNRNEIKEIGSICLEEGVEDVFRSICRFPKAFQEHVANSGSVSKCDGIPAYADALWFDIDCVDLNEALQNTRALVLRMKEFYGVDHEQLSVYFSGMKGFHLGLPAELIGWEPSDVLHQISKAMAKAIAGDIKIDTAIYSKVSLLRVAGSVHGKTRLYKIQLDPCEFVDTLDIEEIRRRATSNQQWQPMVKPTLVLNKELNELYVSTKTELKGIKMKKEIAEVPPCIASLSEGSEAGERSEAAIRLASYYRENQYSEDETRLELEQWNEKNKPHLTKSELDSVIQSAYKHCYKYRCNDKMLAARCSRECPRYRQKPKNDASDNELATIGEHLSSGEVLEMCYDPNRCPKTFFVLHRNGTNEIVNTFTDLKSGRVFKPFPEDTALTSGAVILPNGVGDNESLDVLFSEIRQHVQALVALSEDDYTIVSLYVLATWRYDSFRSFPYLSIRGDFGTGKSRLLKVVSHLCYKTLISSAASSAPFIFRSLAKFRGSLSVDEADLDDNPNRKELSNILLLGYEKGATVQRCSSELNGYEPMSFPVFGPKLLASRHNYKDQSLESRCIRIVMHATRDARKFRYNLPNDFEQSSQALVAKLLAYRLQNTSVESEEIELDQAGIEPRVAQILQPLYAILSQLQSRVDHRAVLDNLASRMSREVLDSRQDSDEGAVLRCLLDLISSNCCQASLKNMTSDVNAVIGTSKSNWLDEKKVAGILRNSFQLTLQRKNKGTILHISEDDAARIVAYGQRYRLQASPQPDHAPEPTPPSPAALPEDDAEGVLL